jgi:hypothetical protein
MRGLFMNRNNFLLFLLIIFFSLNGCADLKQEPEETAIRIKGKEEMLVARDVGRGAGIFLPRWCGNNALLYIGDNIGVELINFTTKKRVQISENRDDTSFNCTPDGKWVLYVDNDIVRTIEGDMTLDEYAKQDQPRGYAWYLYRYEVATGKRERIAAIGDGEGGWYEALSPDGSKILLGKRWFLAKDMTPPEWEALWFTNDWERFEFTTDWSRYETRWFPDSSGVLQTGRYSNSICVEFFGEDGWVGCFELDLKYEGNIFGLKVDNENRIYFQVSEDYVVTQPFSKHFVYRCEIKKKDLFCEEVLERKGSFSSYAFLSDGDLVYDNSYKDECIRRFTPWRAEGGCVVDRRYGDVEYRDIMLIGVSHDGRWLVFERSNWEWSPSINDFYHKTDLFVIELKKD